jgi:hypothetical protein
MSIKRPNKKGRISVLFGSGCNWVSIRDPDPGRQKLTTKKEKMKKMF